MKEHQDDHVVYTGRALSHADLIAAANTHTADGPTTTSPSSTSSRASSPGGVSLLPRSDPVDAYWSPIVRAHHSELATLTASPPLRPLQPPQPAQPPRRMFFDANRNRVDEHINQAPLPATKSLKERLKTESLCMEYHLRGSCTFTYCKYAHEPDLDAAERKALALRGRVTPCPAGSACDDFGCWRRHVCVKPKCSGGCECWMTHVWRNGRKVWYVWWEGEQQMKEWIV